MKSQLKIVAALSCFVGLATVARAGGDEAADPATSLAKVAVIVTVLNSHSPEGRFACSRPSHACAGPNRGELGIALLSVDKRPEGLAAAVDLLGMKLDGVLSSAHTCALLEKGREALTMIDLADARQLRENCLAEVAGVVRRSRPFFDSVQQGAACRTIAEIESTKAEIREALLATRKCDAE